MDCGNNVGLDQGLIIIHKSYNRAASPPTKKRKKVGDKIAKENNQNTFCLRMKNIPNKGLLRCLICCAPYFLIKQEGNSLGIKGSLPEMAAGEIQRLFCFTAWLFYAHCN